MRYLNNWVYEFSSEWKQMLFASIIATGIIAPVVTLATKKIIKKILKK